MGGGPVMATKPVVVGVDGSEESLRAVEWAALEAKRHSSPLRIVSAPDVHHGYPMHFGTFSDNDLAIPGKIVGYGT